MNDVMEMELESEYQQLTPRPGERRAGSPILRVRTAPASEEIEFMFGDFDQHSGPPGEVELKRDDKLRSSFDFLEARRHAARASASRRTSRNRT